MMPHPERVFRTVQHSWHPDEWCEDGSWMRLFRNARVWVGWLGAHNSPALPGLARKLPHYGKYGFLVFNGDAPTNIRRASGFLAIDRISRQRPPQAKVGADASPD